ncbi:DNA binding domain protein, excisionase family (fragment) [uncultured Spirochaetota bacterium]|jgi:excisionase family DNA binding protein
METEEFFTVDELAKKLKVEHRFVYMHAKRGRLPCHRIGRTIRFTSKDLQEILARSACQVVE